MNNSRAFVDWVEVATDQQSQLMQLPRSIVPSQGSSRTNKRNSLKLPLLVCRRETYQQTSGFDIKVRSIRAALICHSVHRPHWATDTHRRAVQRRLCCSIKLLCRFQRWDSSHGPYGGWISTNGRTHLELLASLYLEIWLRASGAMGTFCRHVVTKRKYFKGGEKKKGRCRAMGEKDGKTKCGNRITTIFLSTSRIRDLEERQTHKLSQRRIFFLPTKDWTF